MWKTALKPRWIAGFVFAIAVSGVFVLLSQWQFGRSTSPEVPTNPATEQVQPLTETLQPGEFFHGTDADQMVSAQGSYDPSKQLLVPGRLHDGKTGDAAGQTRLRARVLRAITARPCPCAPANSSARS